MRYFRNVVVAADDVAFIAALTVLALIELKIALEEKMDDVCEDAYAEVQLYEEKWLEEAHREKIMLLKKRR